VLVRGEAATAGGRLALSLVLLAARTCGVPVTVSLSSGEPCPWLGEEREVGAVTETEGELIARLGGEGVERLRALVALSRELRVAAHAAGSSCSTRPSSPRADRATALRAEQTVLRTVHHLWVGAFGIPHLPLSPEERELPEPSPLLGADGRAQTLSLLWGEAG
jgi:hypothetical protein